MFKVTVVLFVTLCFFSKVTCTDHRSTSNLGPLAANCKRSSPTVAYSELRFIALFEGQQGTNFLLLVSLAYGKICDIVMTGILYCTAQRVGT